MLLYVGSSTIANFLSEAEAAYGKARFSLDTVPESFGGERAIQEGHADLAGVACAPSEETVDRGIQATLIGTDTIAVMVNPANPVKELTLAQLRDIFRGRTRSWKDLGGADEPILPLITAPESATHIVFRSAVLGKEDYAGCETVRPDSRLAMKVEAEPGAIGAVSFSFLCAGGMVRVLKVEGEAPFPDNERYPIIRPLYLLWRPGNRSVDAFLAWIGTPQAEEVLVKCFGKPRKVD